MSTEDRSCKVLIAEDSKEFAGRLIHILSELSHVQIVDVVNNGHDALRLIEIRRPDIVILDFQMDGLSGIDVLRTIREAKYTTIVVMLTVHDDPEYRTRCLEAGADYFVNKLHAFEKVLAILGDHSD